MTGAARECTATLSIHPGETAFSIEPLIDHNGNALDAKRWAGMLDLTLEGAGDRYTGTSLVELARHGHFTNADSSWERVSFDKKISERPI